MSALCLRVRGAATALVFGSAMMASAAVIQAQAAWTSLRTDTVHAMPIALAERSLVWVEWLGVPAGATIESVIERADGTVTLPREGLFLPAGSHVLVLRPQGSFLPDTILVRVRSSLVRRVIAASDSAAVLPIDAPVEIREGVAGPIRWRTSIPGASTLVLAASGATPDVRWLDTAGHLRSRGPVVQVAGPTELMVELDGALEPGAAFAVRSLLSLDELEPNDLPLIAADARLDDWFSISLADPEDVDHVALELAEPGVLHLEWGVVPAGVTPVAEIVEEDGTATAMPGTVSAGRRTVRIRSSDGAWSPDLVTARLRFTPTRAAVARDSRTTPRLDWANPVTLRLSAPSWSDSVAVTLPERGVLFLFPHTGDPRANLRVRLRQGHRLVDVESPALGAHVDSGDYVAVLSYEGPPAIGDRQVRLRASFVPNVDPNEPNDTPGLATDVGLPAKVTVRVDGAGDVDWWRFRITEPGILRVARAGSWLVDAPPLAYRIMSLADTTKAVEMRQIQGEGLDVRFVVDSGVYLLEVSGDAAAGRDYVLDLRLDRAQELTTAGGLSVALIGIALPEESERYVRYTATNSGTLYLAASDTAALNAALDSAGALVLRAPSHALRDVLIGSAVALVLGAASVTTWRRRRRVRQARASEYP